VGSYNAPATIRLYAHTSQSRPGGDAARTVGPYDVVLTAKSPGGLIDLPPEFGAVIAAGGGLSIAGGSYVGLASRLDNPEYGKIIQNWSS
jgi:hypothetical protein